MTQFLVLEYSEKAFQNIIDEKIKNGYKVIAGSTLIESKPTYMDADGTMLNDIDHAMTIALTGKHEYMIYTKDISVFKSEVNSRINSNDYKVVVGSFNIGVIKYDGFDHKASRAYLTYYSCALYKD